MQMDKPQHRGKSGKNPLLHRGIEYYERGEYSKSIHQLKKVLMTDPFSEEALKWVEKSMNALTDLEAEIVATIAPVQQPTGIGVENKPVTQKPHQPVNPVTETVKNRIQDDAVPEKKLPSEKIPAKEDLFNRGFMAYRQGKYYVAYDLFELLLKQKPHHKEGQRYRKITQEILKRKFTEKLGSPKKIPVLQNVDPKKFRSFSFSPEEGFLLSRIDGVTPFKHIFYQSQLNTFETCRFFVRLLDVGLITLK